MVAFANQAGRLDGHWPGADLSRLADLQAPPQDLALPSVAWQAQGESVPVAAGDPQWWLALRAQATVWLTCQRCLQPFAQGMTVDRRIRFVRGEAEAEVLDAECEDDVLALPRWLDLRELVEDELLLALPLVPHHPAACPQPLPMALDIAPEESVAERPNPFAALQALKAAKPGRGG